MPKLLLDRCIPDCIVGFREAAKVRFADGLAVERGGRERRTGAIYLWGYAAEMTIKAAYFATIGFDDDRVITLKDLRDAANVGLASTIHRPVKGKLHNVRAWAELLTKVRSSKASLAYPEPSIGDTVVSMGGDLSRSGARNCDIMEMLRTSTRSVASEMRRVGSWTTHHDFESPPCPEK